MKLSTLDIVVLVAYFIAMIRVGFYVTRRVPSYGSSDTRMTLGPAVEKLLDCEMSRYSRDYSGSIFKVSS